ncbi:MAG: NFACT RNA binding domain-containing protein [Cyanobacteria bacterium J06627_28]
MQPVDFTTVMAVRAELQAHWLPARCEQVYQRDRFTIFMALRTLERRGWLAISWHPQAARIHMAPPPPKQPDTFTFSQQLKHQLGGLALTQISLLSPWERVLDLQFARRPDEPALWHVYVEVMGKYSNVILTAADNQIVTAAHQVSSQQSSVRPIQTGKPYEHPPAIRGKLPDAAEALVDWRDRITLIPGPLKKMLVKAYSGVSSSVASQLIFAAGLPPKVTTEDLSEADWQQLFQVWQGWLKCLIEDKFSPALLSTGGYTVLSNLLPPTVQSAAQSAVQPTIQSAVQPAIQPAESVQTLLDDYYRFQFNQTAFRQLHHQLAQALKTRLAKLRQKAATFTTRLLQSKEADSYRQKADLLMASLTEWQPGMTEIKLTDFETGEPIAIALNPEKNAVQNAQYLYKQHQKLKRARIAVMPLLAEVNDEIHYLEQVEDSLLQVPAYQHEADLQSLEEIRSELIELGYVRDTTGRSQGQTKGQNTAQQGKGQSKGQGKGQSKGRSNRQKGKMPTINCHLYTLPQGLTVMIGRNNNQNEQLTFKQATDYDLWLHAQEIPGSHVLLRLNAGEVPTDETLQLAASFAAYYSRARQSEQVPVVMTAPKHVYKPKGALPGMVIYKHEEVLWGQPQQAQSFIDDL